MRQYGDNYKRCRASPAAGGFLKILSCISGTSCDGISWALAEVGKSGGRMKFSVIGSGNAPYSRKLNSALLRVTNSGRATMAELCDLHWSIGRRLADIGRQLKTAPQVAVFSGHTVYHTEQVGRTGAGTFQIGAVEPLSVELGIPVMGDLRSTDVAAGGMGAPLVPAGDELMFGRGSAVLNMGGIANLTLLGETTTGFDTGPGNMLIDEAARTLFGRRMDSGGKIAMSGTVDEKLLSAMMKDPFVDAAPPKSCGRERYGSAFFARMLRRAEGRGIAKRDVVTTFSEFTVRSVLRNLELHAPGYRRLVCAGGGSFNGYLMKRFGELFEGSVHTSDEFGVPRDSRESLAFALICYLSLSLKAGNTDATGAKRKLPLGRVTANGFGRELLRSL